MFRIGIGPSSLHTVGPIVAVARFFEDLDATGSLVETCRVVCRLYGFLAFTGEESCHGYGGRAWPSMG